MTDKKFYGLILLLGLLGWSLHFKYLIVLDNVFLLQHFGDKMLIEFKVQVSIRKWEVLVLQLPPC